MKYLRLGIALILTIVLLGIAKRTSTRHSEELSIQIGDITVVHHTVTEDFGDGPVLDINVPYIEGLSAVAFYSKEIGGPYTVDTLVQTADGFTGVLPVLPKGQKWFYHIDMIKDGASAGRFPAEGDQFIKFKAHVPPYIIIPHIICMFATIFFGLMTVFTAFDIKKGVENLAKSVRYALWTVIAVFIGGFPLGYWVAYVAFGQGWSGIPIGWDITDNKTVIIFLLWLITLILARDGLKGRKMAISNRTYQILTVASLVISVILFMVPHSI